MENSQNAGEGVLLAGRYRLGAAIGQGGMGRVWRAHDELLHRVVAIKELTAGMYASAADRDILHVRTQNEARAAARISHPGVVTVHDVLNHDARPWIVMQYVDGPSLADVTRDSGHVPVPEATRIGLQVVRALGAAHTAGVLHRDVKPANVLIGGDGRALITDFGIAAIEGDSALTRTGEIVGSIDYLAPERVRGHDPGPASDLWSLGATLYAAVEGVSPFRRSSPLTTMQAVITDEPPHPGRAGPLTPVIMALLSKEPTARPSVAEAERMLQSVLDGGDTAVVPQAAALAAPPAPGPAPGAPPAPASGPAPGPPSGSVAPPGAVPAPPDATPPGSVPAAPGSVPYGSVPPGSVPYGSVPYGSVPPGSVPYGSVPPGSVPYGTGTSGSAPAAPDSVPPGSVPPAAGGGRSDGPYESTRVVTQEQPVPPMPQPLTAPAPVMPAPAPVTLAPAPAGPPRRKGGRLRTAAIVVTLSAAVGIGSAFVAVRLADDGKEKGDDAGRRPAAQQSAPATSAPSTTRSSPPSTTPSPSAPSAHTSPTASSGSDSVPDGVPDGWRRAQDPAGFSLLVPEGWTRKETGGQIDYTPDNGRHLLRIGIDRSPDFESPYAHVLDLEKNLSKRLPAYQQLTLQPNVFRDRTKAALWEFSWTERETFPGQRRAIDQVYYGDDGTEYALYMSGPAEDWAETREQFDTMLRSWQPPR
ncbi:protein kinase domain-containing protein [Streptomyces sp. NPDC055078]